MKNRRKAILIVVLLLIVAGSVAWTMRKTSVSLASLHGPSSPPEHRRPSVKSNTDAVAMISKRLRLNPAQEQSIGKLVGESQPQIAAIQADKTLTAEQKAQRSNDAMHAMIDRIGKELSPQQSADFKKLIVEMHGKH